MSWRGIRTYKRAGWAAMGVVSTMMLLPVLGRPSGGQAGPLDDIKNKTRRDQQRIRKEYEKHSRLILAEFQSLARQVATRKPGMKLSMPLKARSATNIVQHRSAPGRKEARRLFAYVDRAYGLRERPMPGPNAGTGLVDARAGEKVEVVLILNRAASTQRDRTFRWCLVRTAEDEEGYIPSSYLRSTIKPEKNRIKHGYAFVAERTGAPLRKGPDSAGRMIARLPFRAEVKLVRRSRLKDSSSGTIDYWHYVRYRSMNGWIFGSALKERRPKKPLMPGDTRPFIVPVQGGRTSNFGPRIDPITKKSGSFHSGVDIAAPRGTPVMAAVDGTVIRRGRASGYGKLIMIQHAHQVVTYYAHLSGFAVKQGRRVARGQVIGFVGSTGRSTGPHLHFEVRSGGTARNPDDYLPQ